MPEHVLILGATSAIAAEVASIHAARGDRLHLIARSSEKLEQVRARCAQVHPQGDRELSTASADFSRVEEAHLLIEGAQLALGHFDRVLIAHGALGDQLESERDFRAAAKILEVNLTSVIAQLIPIANQLEAQRSGRLGVITSVAGERGRPRNYTYGTAKGALHVYLQGLRSRLYPAGVSVTTIKLGPVDTPMTVGHEKNLFFSTAPRVARAITHALDRKKSEVFVPWFWTLILLGVRLAPEWLFQRLRFLSGR